ncbi:response regulator transcription factor [Thomasclavelia cocleata]|uniref:response regulator transcription factor n=1 Tax=Thomasclavelia cocleata TaxID=69824 RepID=UPI00272EB5FC|nr:response regulator transcription factor [Thomasclavelia cocleata]
MNILIIEDEYSLADAIAEILKKEKFNINIQTNGEDGENETLTGNYDLILLDVMLPQKNGFEILTSLRKAKIKTPIIMLTAKSEMSDKLNGLENGADDYITKPFSTRELIARIKIILKRANDIEDTSILEFGDLTLDIKNAKVKCKDNEIQISGKELELLEQLLINKNQVSIRENLAQRIWGYENDSEYNNVEVYITFLRRKLNLLQSKVKVKAVRGIGYKLEEKND